VVAPRSVLQLSEAKAFYVSTKPLARPYNSSCTAAESSGRRDGKRYRWMTAREQAFWPAQWP